MNHINYWLLKSEANVFAIDDLINSPGQRTLWDGVRNYQARNYLGQMRPGDLAFFYHSNGRPSAIVGVVRVSGPAEVEAEKWLAVPVEFVEKFSVPLALNEIRAEPRLADLPLLKQSRLSVSPLRAEQWSIIRLLISAKELNG